MKTICLRYETTFETSKIKKSYEKAVKDQIEFVCEMETAMNDGMYVSKNKSII